MHFQSGSTLISFGFFFEIVFLVFNLFLQDMLESWNKMDKKSAFEKKVGYYWFDLIENSDNLTSYHPSAIAY